MIIVAQVNVMWLRFGWGRGRGNNKQIHTLNTTAADLNTLCAKYKCPSVSMKLQKRKRKERRRVDKRREKSRKENRRKREEKQKKRKEEGKAKKRKTR